MIRRLVILSFVCWAASVRPANAETTRLGILDAVTAPAHVGLALSAMHGDGFWDSSRNLANQTNTLREERLEVIAGTDVRRGVFIGMAVPAVHRELDQAAPGSKDAGTFGLGDAAFNVGWRDPKWRWRLRPGAEFLWKTPTGRANLGLEDVDRGSPAVAPTGTGGNDIDVWAGSLFDGGPLTLGLALGYRKRFETEVAYVFNGTRWTDTAPRERLQARLEAEANLREKLSLRLGFESFKEILIFDDRRASLGQNRSWGSFADVGLRVPLTWGDATLAWSFPAVGRAYPALPPEQFHEREPLLGNRLSVTVRWLVWQDRDHANAEGSP